MFADDMSTNHVDYWNHVLFADEMKISLFGSDSTKHDQRRGDVEYKDQSVMPTVIHGSGNVMIWGYMSAAGIGELYFIKRKMNFNMYFEILQQNIILSKLRL